MRYVATYVNDRKWETVWNNEKKKCDLFQRYYFGKPVNKNTFEKLFPAHSIVQGYPLIEILSARNFIIAISRLNNKK